MVGKKVDSETGKHGYIVNPSGMKFPCSYAKQAPRPPWYRDRRKPVLEFEKPLTESSGQP